MDRKDKLFVVNEVSGELEYTVFKSFALTPPAHGMSLYFQVCEIKNCNKCLFFEAKKKQDLYMWQVYDFC